MKTTDKIPHAIDVEKQVLGAILLDKDSYPKIMSIIGESDFYEPNHARYFVAMSSLYNLGYPIDCITVIEELTRSGKFNAKQDPIKLTELASSVSSAANVKHNAGILHQYEMKRRYITLGGELQKIGLDDTSDPLEALDEIELKVLDIRKSINVKNTEHIGDNLEVIHTRIDKMRRGDTKGIKRFYFRDIDGVTGGMQNGELTIVSGSEKSGKTSFSLQVIMENAKRKIPVLLFSQEMTIEQIKIRYAIIKTGVNYADMVNGKLTNEEYHQLHEAVDELAGVPIYINERMNSILDIRADIQTQININKIGLMVVDYIQIVMPPEMKRNTTREQEVATISRMLKFIAKEYNIPVIALSQLNEEGKTRESRAIQQDMDKMITLKRTDIIDYNRGGFPVDIKVQQRMGFSGAFGDLQLWYNTNTGSFANMEVFAATPNQLLPHSPLS